MIPAFKSGAQQQLFDEVVSHLQGIGYRGELLQKGYTFNDYFVTDEPVRTVPAVAFGRISQQSYDSACFAVLVSNGVPSTELIMQVRALGAPFAFEVREDAVAQWRVAKDVAGIRERIHIPARDLERVFREHREEWSSTEILRTKNIGFRLGPQQGHLLVDEGLIPALEHEICTKLDARLREIVKDANKVHRRSTSHPPNEQELFRLIFRLLAAKVLHDKGEAPFSSLMSFSDIRAVLSLVERVYRAGDQTILSDPETQQIVADKLWSKVDFRHLSVEVLAYIYENTLVDAQMRDTQGTHSTPHPVARYIVHHLPFDKIGETEPLILEPFAGHGILLVAALQRLRDLLPPNMGPKERHAYFVKVLRGFEKDPFAVEVSRLCLMLADLPNWNGWELHREDVFTSSTLTSDLRKAGVVIANPPFGDFTTQERGRYGQLRSVHKPAEFLYRVLDHAPAPTMLGLVLPEQFLDGSGYRELRGMIAERFQAVEVVSLPDKVFRKSDLETVLLIASVPCIERGTQVAVSYAEVRENDYDRFLIEYAVSRRDLEDKDGAAARESFGVLPLGEIWEHFNGLTLLGAAADVHRGIEWQPPFKDKKALYVQPRPKSGYHRGLLQARRLVGFETPPVVYLNMEPEHQRGAAHQLKWHLPKTFLNAARASRGPWANVAFSDESGLVGSQRFHAIWPRNPWTTKSLAAVLNGPVACAFVATRENKRDIRVQTVRKIPLPSLEKNDVETVDHLVDQYIALVQEAHGTLFQASATDRNDAARSLLLQIDAIILRGYGLSPRLERQLLDYFRGDSRRVGFPFGDYFPESFRSTIPLGLYISDEYKNSTPEYFMSHAPGITDPELIAALEEVE